MAELQYSIERVDLATHQRETFGSRRPTTKGYNIVDLGAVRAAKESLSEGNTSDDPIAFALQPMQLTQEEAEAMQVFMAHGTASPTIPTRRVPQGDRSLLKRNQP